MQLLVCVRLYQYRLLFSFSSVSGLTGCVEPWKNFPWHVLDVLGLSSAMALLTVPSIVALFTVSNGLWLHLSSSRRLASLTCSVLHVAGRRLYGTRRQ
jgi:hypothetical protein